MAYEKDMQVVYDAVTKSAVVIFRDVLSILGPFSNARSAYDAGEQHCRDNGWDDSRNLNVTPGGSIMDV
jgi:hypothetical protein